MIKLLMFKNIKCPKHILILSIYIIITCTTFYIITKKYTYDVYKTYGLIKCNDSCYLNISLNYQKTNILDNAIILIDDKKYKYQSITYGEQYLNNNIPEQEVLIELNDKLEEKIVEVKIKYNKQRIITKLKNNIIER